MKAIIALYHDTEKDSEVYWDVAETAEKYGITILETDRHDWGGESVFEVEGTPNELQIFSREFCTADDIKELYPSNEILDVYWDTTPESIVEHYSILGDDGKKYIPAGSFPKLAQTIDSYTSFQIGIIEAGENI